MWFFKRQFVAKALFLPQKNNACRFALFPSVQEAGPLQILDFRILRVELVFAVRLRCQIHLLNPSSRIRGSVLPGQSANYSKSPCLGCFPGFPSSDPAQSIRILVCLVAIDAPSNSMGSWIRNLSAGPGENRPKRAKWRVVNVRVRILVWSAQDSTKRS